MLTDVKKDAALAYCRLNLSDMSDTEKQLFDDICLGAIGYLSDAGVSAPNEAVDPLRAASYRLCFYALVLDAWDNRNPIVEQAATVDNPAFRRRLNQLKLTEPVPDSGTGAGA